MRALACSALVLVAGCNLVFGLDTVAVGDGDGGTASDGGVGDGGVGDGGGSLPVPTRVPTCDGVRALVAAAADTSNDLDLITRCPDDIGVTLNLGLRTYGAASSITLSSPTAVAMGDVNGDGSNDVVVATAISLQLYTGNGAGGFALLDGETVAGIVDLEVGDLLGSDLAADIGAVSAVGLRLYPGSLGGFGTGVPFQQALATRIALVDVDHDSRLDLAIAGSNDTVTMRYQSDGYAPTLSSEVGGGALAAGELVTGGGGELAVAMVAAPTVAIASPSGGGLEAGTPALLTATATAVAVGELDGDGFGDVAVITAAMPRLELFYNDGDRGLIPGPMLQLDDVPTDVVIADLDGDGHDDVALTMPTLGEVWIYWGPF